jgi:hypothetical protein
MTGIGLWRCASRVCAIGRRASTTWRAPGGFQREVQPRRQHWFLNEMSGFPFRTPAFCSVSRGRRRLGEKEYRAPSVTPGVALRPGTQARSGGNRIALRPALDALSSPLSEGPSPGDLALMLAALLSKGAPGLSATAIAKLSDIWID